jgi:hypothetical protein
MAMRITSPGHGRACTGHGDDFSAEFAPVTNLASVQSNLSRLPGR